VLSTTTASGLATTIITLTILNYNYQSSNNYSTTTTASPAITTADSLAMITITTRKIALMLTTRQALLNDLSQKAQS
jgi:hypothetical protein